MFRFFKRENLRSTRRRSASCPNLECSVVENNFEQTVEFQERDGSFSTSDSDNGTTSPSRLEQLRAQKSIRRVRKREKEKKENVEKNLISMDDYLAKLPDLKTWLKEERKKDVESIRSPKLKVHFKTFMRLWNKRKLPVKYYRGCCVDADNMLEKSPVVQKALLEEPLTPSFSPFPLPIDLSSQSSIIHKTGSPFSTFGKSTEDPLTSPAALSEEVLSSPSAFQVTRKEVKSMFDSTADGKQRFATITRSTQVGSFMKMPRGSVKLQPIESPKCPTLSHLPDGPSFCLSPTVHSQPEEGKRMFPHNFTLGAEGYTDSSWTLDQEKKDPNYISPAYAYVKDAIPYTQESPKYADLDGEAVRLPESDYCSLSPIREWYPPENQDKQIGPANSAFGRRRSKSLEDIYAVPVRANKIRRKCSTADEELNKSKTPPIPDRKYSPKKVFSLLSQIPRPKPFGLIQPQSPSDKIENDIISVLQFQYENEDTKGLESKNLKLPADSIRLKSPKKRRSQESVQSLQDENMSKMPRTSSMLSSTPKEALAKEEFSETSLDISPKLSILTGSLKATTRKPKALEEEEMHDTNKEARLSTLQLQQFEESPKFPRRKLKRRSSNLSTTPGKGLTFGKNSKMASSSPRRVSFAKDVKDTDEKTTPRRSSNARKVALPIMGIRSCTRQTRERLEFEQFLSAHEESSSQNKVSNSPTKSPSPNKISPIKMITSLRKGIAEMKGFNANTMTSNKGHSNLSTFVPVKKKQVTVGDMCKGVSSQNINIQDEMLFPVSPTRQLGRRALGIHSNSPQGKMMKESSSDLTSKSDCKRNLFSPSDSGTKTDVNCGAAPYVSVFVKKANVEDSNLSKSQMQHQVDSLPLVPPSLCKPAQNFKTLDSVSQNLSKGSPPPVPSSLGRSPLKSSGPHLSEQEMIEILMSDHPPPPLPPRRYLQKEVSAQKSCNSGKPIEAKTLTESLRKKASTPKKSMENKMLAGESRAGSLSPTKRHAEGLIRKLSCLDVKEQDSTTEDVSMKSGNCALNVLTSRNYNSARDLNEKGEIIQEQTSNELYQQSSSPKAIEFDNQSEKASAQREVTHMENSRGFVTSEKKGRMRTTTFDARGEILVAHHGALDTSLITMPVCNDIMLAKDVKLKTNKPVKKDSDIVPTRFDDEEKRWISTNQTDKTVEESMEKSKEFAYYEKVNTQEVTTLNSQANSHICHSEQNTQTLENDRNIREGIECIDSSDIDKESIVCKGSLNSGVSFAGKKQQSQKKPMLNHWSRAAHKDQPLKPMSAMNSDRTLTKPKLILLEKKESCPERSFLVCPPKKGEKTETSLQKLPQNVDQLKHAQCLQPFVDKISQQKSEAYIQNPITNDKHKSPFKHQLQETHWSQISSQSENCDSETIEHTPISNNEKSISEESEMDRDLNYEELMDEKESCKEADGSDCSLQRLESIRASPKIIENDSWITARRRSSRGKLPHSFRSAHNRYLLRSASKDEEEALVKLGGTDQSNEILATELPGSDSKGQSDTNVKSRDSKESSSEKQDTDSPSGTHSCLIPERKDDVTQDSSQSSRRTDNGNNDDTLACALKSINVKKVKPPVPPKTLSKCPKVMAIAQRRLNVHNFVSSPSSRTHRSSISKTVTENSQNKTGPPVVKRRSSLVTKSPKTSCSSPSSKVTAIQKNSTITPKRQSSITNSELIRASGNSAMLQKDNSLKKKEPKLSSDSGKITPPTPRWTGQKVSSCRRSSIVRRRSKENKGEEGNKIPSFSDRKKFFQQLQSHNGSTKCSQLVQPAVSASRQKPEQKGKIDSNACLRGTERNMPQTLKKQGIHLALSPQSELKL